MTENISKTIKVFYMHHQDGLSRLSPLLLLDGRRIWHMATKKKFNGTMYYLFLTESLYIKLWRDAKGNLLFHIDSYAENLFFDEEPDIFGLDRTIQWDDDFILCRERKIVFTIPIIRIVKTINPWAQYPLVYVLHHMFCTKDDTSAPVAPQEPSQGDLSRE